MSAPMNETLADLKRQIQQLDELSRSGALPADTAAAARAALERRLVDAVLTAPPEAIDPVTTTDRTQAAGSAGTNGASSASAGPSRRLRWGLLVFVLAFGAAGYAWRGSMAGWSESTGPAMTGDAMAAAPAASAAASAPHSMSTSQIEGMVSSLAARLETQSDDADGWLMLGRSYAVLARFDEAIPAYRKVLALRPRDAQAMADLADALAMKQQRRFSGEPMALITAALAVDPDNVKALSLAGTRSFETQDYATAIRHWSRAVAVASPGSDMALRLRENLAEARQRAGMPPAAADVAAIPAAAASAPTALPESNGRPATGGHAVSGRVTLSPALLAKAGPDDVLFIFARPATGARMPLAILKHRVRDLPLDFTLGDEQAMSPDARLSSATSVVVGARVSKSGQAMPQVGDLQGLSAAVSPGAKGLNIVIAEEVR